MGLERQSRLTYEPNGSHGHRSRLATLGGKERQARLSRIDGTHDSFAGGDVRNPAAALTAGGCEQVTAVEIDKWIGELDSEHFAVRNKATSMLARLGVVAGGALRQAQVSSNSLEAQRRLKLLVERLDQPTLAADEIRLVRAVEVLEKIGSPQARRSCTRSPRERRNTALPWKRKRRCHVCKGIDRRHCQVPRMIRGIRSTSSRGLDSMLTL